MKKLYSFCLSKEISKQKTETKVENGEEIKVTRTVKEKVPVEISFIAPTSKVLQDLKEQRAIDYSTLIKNNVLSKGMLFKKLNEAGVERAISSEDVDEFVEANNKKEIAKLQYQKIIERFPELDLKNGKIPEEAKDDVANVLKILEEANVSIDRITKDYEEVISSTAEHIRDEKYVLNTILMLSYWNVNGVEEPIFSGKDLSQKRNSYFKLEDDVEWSNYKLYKAASLVLSWVAAYYFKAGEVDKEILDNLIGEQDILKDFIWEDTTEKENNEKKMEKVDSLKDEENEDNSEKESSVAKVDE